MPTARARAESLVDALRVDAAETDREGGFPVHSIELLRGAGLLAAALPAERGGESLGAASRTRDLLELLAAVGRGSLVVGRLFEGHVNALQLIERFGSAVQREHCAADAIAGHLFGVWNTEAADGVRLAGSGPTLLLSGAKTFASGLGHVSRALITARRDEPGCVGLQMLVLRADEARPREDRSFWQPLGMRASASFRADMSGLRVAADALLGPIGAYYAQPAFSGGAIRFAAVQLGGAEAVHDETRRFLRAQGRVDDPYQRARLGEMAWRLQSARQWFDGAAANAAVAMSASATHDGDATTQAAAAERAVAFANMMRCAIEDTCLRVLALAERSVGARGLLRPEPFERMHRDLVHYLRQPAPDAAQAEVGRFVLADARSAAAMWSAPTAP